MNHKVKDFNKWKPIYEKDAATRAHYGLKELHLARKADNPNEVYMIFETNDVAKSLKMMDDPELGRKMQEAGVLGPQTINILDKA